MAGVERVRRGTAQPIGSLTQMATIRLGRRTENRNPLIRDLVALAGLDSLVFGAWDPIPDDAATAARKAGVLVDADIESVSEFLGAIRPMPAVFDNRYVTRIKGTNVKTGKTKRDLAEQLRQDIRDFKVRHKLDRVVMVWCASTEVFIRPRAAARHARGLREGDGRERRGDRPVDALRLRRDRRRCAIRQRRAEPDGRHSPASYSSPVIVASRSQERISRPARRG